MFSLPPKAWHFYNLNPGAILAKFFSWNFWSKNLSTVFLNYEAIFCPPPQQRLNTPKS